jgi:hypothetical protein
MANLWSPAQLVTIEKRSPTQEIATMVTEIRRLQTIVMRADDVTKEWDRCRRLGHASDALSDRMASLKESLDTPRTALEI